ncbi:unnamed protein product, partial [Oppiella nova]
NTLTHRSGTPKYKVETSWTPPRGFIGGVIFRATIVQSKNVFWTALDSQSIHISAPVVIQHKPNLAYNRQGDIAESKQSAPPGDNIHASSVPHSQSSTDASHSRISYDICDKKFCIGLPVNCVKFRTCNMLLAGGYVSRGDGDDSVTDCMVTDGRPVLRNSVNIGRSNEYLSANEYHGVSPLNTTYSNGILYCKWRRRRRSTVRGNAYDLKDKKYYILLAFGLLGANEDKEFHTERLASDQSVDIRVVGHVITHSTTFLIQIHGTFMIVAWLGCVSIAIFMARYFKHLWPEETLFGVQIWFAGPHQLFGLAAIIISVVNPIGAAMRPKPLSSKRWIFNWFHFNWFHFVLGNAGHICAITALFLAYNLSVNQLSQIYLWILIMYEITIT